MASPMTSSHLTLSDPGRSKSRSLGFWGEGNLHGIDIFTSSNITTLIWMSQKVRSLLAGVVFRCPSGLSCSYCVYCTPGPILICTHRHVTV